ncbi:MAG: ABC transporter substrate-binding protein, partial [Deltaproteobacteria bacterium]|nr:ABC transporter substrate-binding protein [Deltaproteobacteria bacterium]
MEETKGKRKSDVRFLKKRTMLSVSFVLALALLLVLGLTPVAMAEKTVKIGVLAPISGPAGADGEEFVRGAKLAAKEINDAGGAEGFKFEVVSADTKDMKPDSVLTAVNRLLTDPEVGIVLTGYCSNSNFEVKNMGDAGMPYIIAG